MPTLAFEQASVVQGNATRVERKFSSLAPSNHPAQKRMRMALALSSAKPNPALFLRLTGLEQGST
jgi:hypothetical protein